MNEKKEIQTEILNSIHIGICIIEMKDPDSIRTLFFNHCMLEILGLSSVDSEDDPLIMDYRENPMSCVHPADYERVEETFRDGYDKPFFVVNNFRMRDTSGTYVWFKTEVSLFEQEGKIHRCYATYQAVNEEVRLHYELTERLNLEQQLRSQADKANKLKSSFLSSVSHDMRTPLNAVLGYTDLALATQDAAERQDYLEKIRQSGSILKELINDTLDLSRMESGKMTLKPEVVSLYQVIEKIVMTVRPAMEAKSIKFDLKIDEQLRTNIYMDVLKVQEIILNLLSNAVKFTPEGGIIRFYAEAVNITDNEVHARFTVQDSGIGMSEEFLRRIYEPFAQERTTETANIEGSGLGLTIVKKIIDMMGGTIDVTSKMGKGTTFVLTVTLPRASKDTNSYIMHADARPMNLKQIRFLLVEDNTFNLEIARKILEQQGAEVETAGNGREGTDLFAASEPGHFNAILLDIRMPVMNGYEAAKEIRAMEREDAHSIPIIAMSADAYPEDIQKSMDAGMNAHLAKPINVAQLAEVLQKYIRK
jgi:signal transduction histidine kinase/CheY-like chemotaxis protein